MDKERKLLVDELVKHINNSIIQQTEIFVYTRNDVCLCATNPKSYTKIYFKQYLRHDGWKYEILFSAYRCYRLPENEQLFRLAQERYKEQINTRPEQHLHDLEDKLGLYEILLRSNNKSNVR